MSVYIDSAFLPYRGMNMCHMIADTVEELHQMADRIGLKRSWFQDSPPASFPHYDVSTGKRSQAVLAGAIECERFEFVMNMRRIRAEMKEEKRG